MSLHFSCVVFGADILLLQLASHDSYWITGISIPRGDSVIDDVAMDVRGDLWGHFHH